MTIGDRPSKSDRTREAALAVARACARVLKKEFGARKAYVFGSAIGQSPWHSHSDIDIAVEGLAPEKYVSALSSLYELLPEGIELDLITLEDAPPELVSRIKGEVEMPEDPKAALEQEIGDELANIDRLLSEAGDLLDQVSGKPGSFHVRAAGSLVHDFYTAIERIFERIAVRFGPGLPSGDAWHTLLLRSMESPAEGIRPAVITHDLALELVDYLRFRHLFRHSYGYELQWDKLRPLVEGMEAVAARLRQEIRRFMTALEER